MREQKAQARANGQTAFVFDCGDVIEATFFFREYGGEPFADWMNLAGYDAMTFGNHEFDYGPEALKKFVERLHFPVLSANVRFTGYSPLIALYEGGIVTIKEGEEEKYGGKIYEGAIFERSGRRYGVFGLTTPEARQYVPGRYGVRFDAPILPIAVEMIQKLRAHGADLIILLSHLGIEHDENLATHPEIVKAGGIAVIFSGHHKDR